MQHGVMFHHFHNDSIHLRCQGSLDALELDSLLDYYQKSYKILSAHEFYSKALQGKLGITDVCLTFDDTLKNQYDVAYPVLRKRGITAFWFVNSMPLQGEMEMLEVYHHFRFKMFSDIDEFYNSFFNTAQELQQELNVNLESGLSGFDPNIFKANATFYTYNDKKFRYIRDILLKEEKYNYVMKKMMVKMKYYPEQYRNILWMSVEDIKCLYEEGNIIGLHSHSHPTTLACLSYEEQMREFGENKDILSSYGILADTVSYPCNEYNADTLDIIKKLNIKLGFRANMQGEKSSVLEMPRQNHTYILKRMRNEDNSIYR